MSLLRLFPVGFLALFLSACGSEPHEARQGPAEPLRAAPPADLPSESPTSQAVPLRAGGLELHVDPAWSARTPSSSMRLAELRLDGSGGPASLVVYYFGGGGGSVEANMERWLSQLEQPSGRATSEIAERSTIEAEGATVHAVAASGTYVAETRPGSGERHDEPDWRLLAAVVEGRGGPWFLKLVGPEETVQAHEPAWERMLASLRVAG